MDGRFLTIPIIGFGVAFVAAATLQPVIGSFSKAYRFGGDVYVAAAAPVSTPTPNGGVYPITVTPTPSLTPRASQPVASVTPTGNAAEDATETTTSSATPRAATSPTATANSSRTATATSTSVSTSTPSPTSTPDPCGSARDAQLVFAPASQDIVARSAAGGSLTLTNEGAHGHARDVVVRAVPVRGAAYLISLRLFTSNTVSESDQAAELRVPDLGPREALELRFEARLAWANSLASAALAPEVVLRIEVVSDSCRPASSPQPAASAAITMRPPKPTPIAATPRPVSVSPVEAVP